MRLRLALRTSHYTSPTTNLQASAHAICHQTWGRAGHCISAGASILLSTLSTSSMVNPVQRTLQICFGVVIVQSHPHTFLQSSQLEVEEVKGPAQVLQFRRPQVRDLHIRRVPGQRCDLCLSCYVWFALSRAMQISSCHRFMRLNCLPWWHFSSQPIQDQGQLPGGLRAIVTARVWPGMPLQLVLSLSTEMYSMLECSIPLHAGR